MKTQHFLTGMTAILLLSGYVSGQWQYNGNNIYYNNGKVGIGTTNPGEKLVVSNSTKAAISFNRGSGSGQIEQNAYGGALRLQNTTGSTIIQFRTYGDTYFNGGNVGIGTTSPQSKLAVNGTITAKEVEVTNSGWPDHVFADTYRLRPLAEVEAYIKANRHLPDIPSAVEVAEEGVALGKMQANLLQKVEELTLYLIELQKENDALKARVASLEQEQ